MVTVRPKLAAVTLLLTPTLCLAWGADGHRIVGDIGSNYLTPCAEEAVKFLLGDETLADTSTWADEIKSDRKWDWAKPLPPKSRTLFPSTSSSPPNAKRSSPRRWSYRKKSGAQCARSTLTIVVSALTLRALLHRPGRFLCHSLAQYLNNRVRQARIILVPLDENDSFLKWGPSRYSCFSRRP